MSEMAKQLQNSLARIKKHGGVIMIHHASTGSTDFQLQNGRSVASATVAKLRAAGALVSCDDGLFKGCEQSLRVAP